MPGPGWWVSVDGGEPLPLSEFLALNPDLPERDECALMCCRVGESVELGGGAAASFMVERVAAPASTPPATSKPSLEYCGCGGVGMLARTWDLPALADFHHRPARLGGCGK